MTDEVHRLRHESISSLDASFEYYTHTKVAWRIVQQLARKGHTFSVKNKSTGSSITERELVTLAQGYVTGYLANATFQDFVSIFEHFVFKLLKVILCHYPESLSGKQLNFSVVLENLDKDAFINVVVEKEVRELPYKRVDEWFHYLKKKIKIVALHQCR